MNFKVIKYIDPTISTAGDGLTPATALKALPAITEYGEDELYVIRRTLTELSITSTYDQTNAINKKIGFWGMPMAGKDGYSYLPDEVKAAWDSDANIKPIITARDGNCFRFAKTLNMDFKNLNLQCDLSNAGYERYPAFYFENGQNVENKFGVCNIQNCVFKHPTSWDTSFNSTGSIIYVNNCEDLNIDGNDIWYKDDGDSGMGYSSSLEITSIYHSLLFQNNTVHVVTSSYSSEGGGPGGYAAISLNGSQRNYSDTKILNNTVKVWIWSENDYTGGLPPVIQVNGYCENVYAKKFNVIEEKIVGTPTSLSVTGSLLQLPKIGVFGEIEDIDVNLPSIRKTGTSDLFYFHANSNIARKAIYCKRLNISLGSKPLAPAEIYNVNNDYHPDWGSGFLVHAIDVDITDSRFDNPWGKCVWLEGSNITVDEINGLSRFRYVMGDFKQCKSFQNNIPLFRLDYFNQISLNKIILPDDYKTDIIIPGDSYNEAQTFWIGSSTKPIRLSKGKIANDTEQGGEHFDVGGYVCGNDGADGRFTFYGAGFYADTWACVRKGSSALASLRIKSVRTTIQNKSFSVTKSPAFLTFQDAVPAGHHLVTFYFATAEIPSIEGKIKFEVETSLGVFKSDLNGYIEETQDTWVGAGTVKTYKCVMNIQCADEAINGKIIWNGFGTESTIFVDPKLTINI